MTAAEMERLFHSVLGERITPLGFRHRRGGVYTRASRSADAIGWLGINISGKWGVPILVHVVVGVRLKTVELVVAQLQRSKFHSYQPPTIAGPLDILIPARERGFMSVGDEAEAEAAAARIGLNLGRYGIPWMDAHTEVEAALAFMHEHGLRIPQWEFRQAVLYTLAGQFDEADTFVRRQIAVREGKSDLVADAWRGFGPTFLAYNEQARREARGIP